VPVLDDAAVEQIRSLGGLAAIAISHPHFYAANIDIAEAFDATVFLPCADRACSGPRRGSSSSTRKCSPCRA
jgi:hypothetical protein